MGSVWDFPVGGVYHSVHVARNRESRRRRQLGRIAVGAYGLASWMLTSSCWLTLDFEQRGKIEIALMKRAEHP
jgi:hypothetical protein